jgi:hypothetical protein
MAIVPDVYQSTNIENHTQIIYKGRHQNISKVERRLTKRQNDITV